MHSNNTTGVLQRAKQPAQEPRYEFLGGRMALRKPDADAAREEKGMRENRAVQQQEKPVRGELMTVDEAVKYIRMGKTSLYECLGREIPFFRRPTGKIVIDSADLDDYLRMSRVPAGTVPGNT